ncbi:MAG: hypothetical protein KatS3mg094_036 [Candidatus Parcubacteria bacterium]|nr:MAG: hypothetical protein KatS3mg094_036 [Candidatus Parcubacteria bacterium]
MILIKNKKYLLISFSLIFIFILLILLFAYDKNSNFFQNISKNTSDIIIFNPKENQKISSPLLIQGKARGTWFFEAEFNAELYDDENNLLGKAILTAKSDWMTEDFVNFEGELNFKKPTTKLGKLIFLSANPSGLPEHQKIYKLPVQFENIQYRKIFLYYYNSEKDKDSQGNIKCSEDGLVPIEKEIPLSQNLIQYTINLLLKGKENLNQEEINQGIETEFPLQGLELKSVNLKSDGTLILEFNDPYRQISGGSCRVKILWLQIEKTAKQFPQVKKIEFKPEYLFQP